MFLHNWLNVQVQIANKMGFKKNYNFDWMYCGTAGHRQLEFG
jgi:hypothetical protein